MTRILAACVALVVASTVAAQQEATYSFDSNGVVISYADSGRGVPVLLIHGFTGSASRHFGGTGVISALEQAGYRVIALDCRGHGQSGKPLDSSQYGLEMVHDVIRLLDHLKIDRAHIVGYSMGAGIAEQLLVKYPSRATTVTLLGSGWEGERLAAFTAELNALGDEFDRREATTLIRGVNASGQGGLTEAQVAAAAADLFARNDPRVLAAVVRSLPVLWDLTRIELRAVTVPVLAIDGEFDRDNLDAAKRMVAVVPGLQLIELPGVNHATSVRASTAHIVAFLDKHRDN
jgi:pimeloyl-ACP methyl ester carboxylesterase